VAVLVEQRLPATPEIYAGVNEKLGVDDALPSGLVMHMALVEGDNMRIVDVWESEGDWESFRANDLEPAVAAVLEENGIVPEGPPDVTVTEIHNTLSP
jgi:hypothetical protein